MCIVYNFGVNQASNLSVYAVNNNTFCGISLQIYQTILDLP